MVCFEGALPSERGVPVVNRIREATERAWRAAKADHDRQGRLDSFDAFAADAFWALMMGAADPDEGGVGRGVRADVCLACDVHA